MRIAIALVLAGCGSKSPTIDRSVPPPSNVGVTAIEAPAAPAGVLAVDGWAPPILMIIDSKGQRHLAAAASWSELSAGMLSAGPKPAGLQTSVLAAKEGFFLGKTPKQIVDGFTDTPVGLEDTAGRDATTELDDPPPPEEEDEDESGGTGTAMALEEGRMGQQRGVRGPRWFSPTGDPNAPIRLSFIVGEVTPAKPDKVPAVVFPHPAIEATAVVKAVTELEAMIGVRSGATVRPLRVQFHRDPNGPVRELGEWLEVRIDGEGLVVEAVPSKATRLAWSDLGKLGAAITDVRNRKRGDARSPVDVLVGTGIDAQRLVDVLVALDTAGVSAIGLGGMAPGSQLALRDRDPAPKQPTTPATPSVATGEPNKQGELDKEIIRRFVKRNLNKIQYCYEKQLLDTPNISGTVQVSFFIKPDGTVASSSGSGVHPAVADCVAQVIKNIEFPKPKGGGGVQVNYPFVFKLGN